MVYGMSTPLFPLDCIENEIAHFQRRHEAFKQSKVKDIWNLKCKGHLIFKFTILYCIITTNILTLIKWIFVLFLFIESLIKGIFIIKILQSKYHKYYYQSNHYLNHISKACIIFIH
eukprot:UN12498